MKKRLLAWLLTAAMMIGLVPATMVSAMAAELSDVYTLSDDYISVSVSKRNGGFTVRTVEGDRLKKSDNDKDLLYHDGQYDTSFLSFRVGTGNAAKDYIFGGKYTGSSNVAVTEQNGSIQAVWSVDGLTFTQSISLTNTSSNESGMVSLSVSVKNNSGEEVPVKVRILYDTALGAQDFGYYQYTDSSTQQSVTVQQEMVLTSGIPDQMFATDDPYSPSIVAYTVTSGSLKPYQAAFGHWSHLASTLFDFTALATLDFTNTRSEYMTADSACALYFDLGRVDQGGSSSLSTFYGVFSNHATPASDSVAVNLTAPVRLTLTDDKTDFVPESGAVGDATFAVTVDFTNIAGEDAQDLTDIVLAVRSSRNLRSLTDQGNVADGQDYDTTEPFTIDYSELTVGESRTKTLYFQAKPGTDATYERITIGIYQLDSNGQLSETNKLGERLAYVLLPGSDNDVPKVNFAAMTPKIIYTEGTRHLFVTVTNENMLANEGNWDLKVYSEDGKVCVPVPHTNITIKEGVMDVALTDNIQLSEGGWYLQLEWADNVVGEGEGKLVPEKDRYQTAPELHFTVSNDKKYKNDAYGVLAVVETIDPADNGSIYKIKAFSDEEAFKTFQNKTDEYEEILLIFKGEFTKKEGSARPYYIATSTKTTGTDGKSSVDNPIVINDCMDFENGSLEVYEDDDGAICTEFDGDIYTNTERTQIWTGKAIFTKIEQGEKFSLIPYNQNGVRAVVEDAGNGQKKLNTNAAENFTDNTISLIWPVANGIGQTLSGMIFKLAYGELGVMYNTDNQGVITQTLGHVLSFTAALDLTFAKGKVDGYEGEPPTYWSTLCDYWLQYEPDKTGSLYRHIYRDGWYQSNFGHFSNIDEYDTEGNNKDITASIMVRDVLFGCGQGFVGVNFTVGVAIKNYISGLPNIEGTISVNTINDWAFSIDGEIKLATFTVEATVSFKSKDDIPVPDELYVFVSGFEPGLNIDGCGVIWITGGGGGVKNLYDTIFMTQSVPPLKLLLSVSFDLMLVLSCEKATLSLGPTGIGLQTGKIGIKGIPGLTAIEKMGLSLEWYPGIDARANISLNLFAGLIQGSGYVVLISPDYDYVFFEIFARAKVMVPNSIPVVGGMQLAGIDLGVNNEKVWGALDVLKITLGVTYYWGEGEVDFGNGTKSQPSFPELLGYDDIPVYYDEENDQTLYMRVGTNTELLASSLPDDGGLELMAAGAWLKSSADKSRHEFNLGTYQAGNEAAIVQIVFDAASKAAAETMADAITVTPKLGGEPYSLIRYDLNKTQEENEAAGANANLTYDENTQKATYAFTVTDPGDYNKVWTMTTPAGSDVLLYNVVEIPKVETVSGSMRTGNESNIIDVSWTGSNLAELDQISFYLCESNDPESSDPGYSIDWIGNVAAESDWFIIPSYVPSGDYYIRAVYSKTDEVNGVVFSTDTVHWVNNDTPGTASFTAKAAGNLQYELTIDPDTKTDSYLVTIYNADGTVTDFERVSYEAAESGSTVINVGGAYDTVDENGNPKQFGLEGGETYIIGVTPYKETVTDYGNGYEEKSVVYGTEVKSSEILLPEMVTPTVTFSAAAQSRTETTNGQTYQKSVYTANTFTITATVSEAVTGTWKLDNDDSTSSTALVGTFTNTATISIPLNDLAEGDHTLTLTGAAADGDSFGTTYTFTVDTLPPQLLLSSPVNGSFFGKDGTLTVTGVTDAGAIFTISGTDCTRKTVEEMGGTFDPATGAFSFQVAISDPNSASQHTLTISVADDVGNATAPKTVEVSHGGLADLASLEVMVNGQTYATGNIPVPAAGLSSAELTLVGVTSDNTRFMLTGYNVSWELTTVEGSASVSDGKFTAAAGSQGIVTGKLAVANGAYRTATLCFGAMANHTVAVSCTIGGSVTGGGAYNPGQQVTLTATPDSGYRFVGWTVLGVTVSDLSAATIAFTMPENGNVTALATFEPISGGSLTGESVFAQAGEVVRVKLPAGESESTYVPCYTDSSGNTVYVPISAVIEGYVTFLAPKDGIYYFASNPVTFRDVPGHWAEDSIAFCASRGIFNGVGDNLFAPSAAMNRAMFATVLYRLAGSPAVSSTDGFKDVADDIWYTDAVLWGQSTGIINGYGDGLFGPDDPVTREQMCALIVRWLDYMGYELPAVKDAKTFTDADQFSSWAREAISYTQTSGLINGMPGGVFAPKNNATRAENSAVFQRMILAILSEAQ
ncbi:MAG: S-layer homology domain-containing protein [Oscillospiraceae bacterium]